MYVKPDIFLTPDSEALFLKISQCKIYLFLEQSVLDTFSKC